jgi:hypothetical protein
VAHNVKTYGPEYTFARQGLPCSRCNDNPIGGGSNSYCIQCRRELQYIARYGITIADYNRLAKQQDNVCAICGRTETVWRAGQDGFKPLSVDHNHNNGMVRGLLCHSCNTALGKLEPYLDNALAYIKKGT